MRVLIVGGTGLISTAITRELLARGDEVTVFNRGRAVAARDGRVAQIVGDRTAAARFEAQIAAAGPFDCSIDMRCFTPAEAESAVRAFRGRARQVILCSTVDVYHKPGTRYPITEDEPIREGPGVFTYAHGKAECERIIMAAHRRGDFAATIIRPAHTYGEGSTVLHTFRGATTYLDRLRRGKPVIVHGDGTSLWSSCHRDDVARAFVAAAGAAQTFGRAYHVTGEEWLTWDRYTALVAEALGAPPPTIVHIPTDLLLALAPERAFWCAHNFAGNNIFDNARARDELDFRQTIPFLEGTRRTIAWLDANGRIVDSDRDPFDDRIIADWERLGDALRLELAGLEQ
jgi:nucleoside-diphosphate-sugar epimerase